jgi:MFS family permease
MFDDKQVQRGRWLALIGALLGWLFDGFEIGIFPLVARPALLDVLHLREPYEAAKEAKDEDARRRIEGTFSTWNARVTAAFLFGAALGGWGFGWLGDRIGRVRAMVFSVLTYALFTGTTGLAQDAWQIALLRFLAALGMGGEWSLGVALVMESWGPRSRPLLAGIIGACGNLGVVLTTVPVMLVHAAGVPLNEGGWRWVLGMCAVPALLTFFLRTFVPESEKWQHAAASGPRPSMTEIFTPGLRYRSIFAAAMGSVALVATWGAVHWITPWVQSETHGPDSQRLTNYAQIALGAGAVCGGFCGAFLGQFVSRRAWYFFLCLGSLLVCGVIFRLDLQGGEAINAGFWLLVWLMGFLSASFYGWLPLYLPELFPTRVRATGQGFGFNFGRVVAGFGTLGMGFLMGERVFHGNIGHAAATISLVYLIGMALAWFAPETKGQGLPE